MDVGFIALVVDEAMDGASVELVFKPFEIKTFKFYF